MEFDLRVPSKTSHSTSSIAGGLEGGLYLLCWGMSNAQGLQHLCRHLLGRQVIGLHEEVAMLPGVGQPFELFGVVCWPPIQGFAPIAALERGLQVDQYIWFGQLLPHGGHVGMLLRNLTCMQPACLQLTGQRGLACTTGSNDGNAQRARFVLQEPYSLFLKPD